MSDDVDSRIDSPIKKSHPTSVPVDTCGEETLTVDTDNKKRENGVPNQRVQDYCLGRTGGIKQKQFEWSVD